MAEIKAVYKANKRRGYSRDKAITMTAGWCGVSREYVRKLTIGLV